MAETPALERPWLVAVWPGMGNVAVGAGVHLVNRLGMTLIDELPAGDHFDIEQVAVKNGVASTPRMPRSMLFGWKNLGAGPDLLVFVGEAQPSTNGYGFCHKLLERAARLGTSRVITFASMASGLHPSQEPRVFCVATDRNGVNELNQHGTQVLEEGEIGGLNGVLLAAAAQRSLPGACLLGEIPFFAVGVPNPKASRAVLHVFASLAGIAIDTGELDKQAEDVEDALIQLLDQMKESARQQGEDEEGFTVPEFLQKQPEQEPEEEKPPTLDFATRSRIEKLFEEARQNRSKAMKLKEELDRLGVFEQYEDRFLDLFKRGE